MLWLARVYLPNPQQHAFVLSHCPEHPPLMRLSHCSGIDDLIGWCAQPPAALTFIFGCSLAPTIMCSGMDDLGLTAYAAGMLGEYLAQHWQDKLAAVSAPWVSASTCFAPLSTWHSTGRTSWRR